VRSSRTGRRHASPEDQVARKEDFLARHPGVAISCDSREHEWNASWKGTAGIRQVKRTELRELLDELEGELDGGISGRSPRPGRH
jgi:hypothetical protein